MVEFKERDRSRLSDSPQNWRMASVSWPLIEMISVSKAGVVFNILMTAPSFSCLIDERSSDFSLLSGVKKVENVFELIFVSLKSFKCSIFGDLLRRLSRAAGRMSSLKSGERLSLIQYFG